MTRTRHKTRKTENRRNGNRQSGMHNATPKHAIQNRKHSLLKWICGVFASLLVIAPFLLYGPFDGFRVFWITTAMHTSDHQYLATALYSSKTITKIMRENAVEILLGETDDSMINIKRSQEIEIIKVRGSSSNGYLLLVHDSARVSLQVSPTEDGFLLEDLCQDRGITAAINASAYLSNNTKGLPLGIAISNGVVVSQGSDTTHSIIGLDWNDCLILGIFEAQEIPSLNLRDAVEYGPFLIMNGEKAKIEGNGGGIAPRTAIGQTEDGTILLLVFDGRQLGSLGATTAEVQDILYQYGAINAACLDGGATASMYYEGRLVNSESGKKDERLLPNAFIVN